MFFNVRLYSVQDQTLHKAGGGLITLTRDNITFTTTDIHTTINTHTIEFQMVMVHINNTKHISIANIYIPPRDSTCTHYKTVDTDIEHCTSQTYNTQSGRYQRALHSLALVYCGP